MAGTKKSKGSGKGKGGGKKDSKKELKRSQEEPAREAQTQLTPQERVAAVKSFWQTLSASEREELLTISLEDLRKNAQLIAAKNKKANRDAEGDLSDGVAVNLEPTLEDVLEQGVSRLKGKGTWKVWQWFSEPEPKEFFDADSFRQYVEENHISEDFRKLLPKDEGKPVEKPAEAALRQRMTDLLQRIQQNTRQLQEEMNYTRRLSRGQRATSDQMHTAVRDTNVDLITHMLEALEREHEFLYHAVLFPVTGYVCEALPENMRESSRTELFFEDLEKLPPEEVARICEWLTEKVDSFSAKLKPEAKEVEEEEEEEGIGDVDLFTLTENYGLTVNKKWLQHLEERLLGDDGHPRKVQEGEDPHRMGLVLEWVYGTIVSTAEKARDAAKRSFGARPPTAVQAHEQLLTALADQQNWELRAKQAKELLKDMLASRRQAAELMETYDIRPVPSRTSEGVLYSQAPSTADELPDQVIVTMLQREVLLTKAKLHALCYEHIMGERRLRSLKAQLRQGEPEFDRLKRELEEVKNQPRGLEGTFRTAAEMERHRAQLADAAIEEQLEVQTAFREHGARLQGIYDRRQRTEIEMAKREQEMKQLQGWKTTVQTLVDRFEELIQASEMFGDIEEGGKPSTTETNETEAAGVVNNSNRTLMLSAQALTQQYAALQKLRVHFSKDVRRQLYTDEDDKQFFDWIQRELRSVEKRLDDGRAALQHLEMHLINVACDDPGASIGSQLALPMLQDRLDAKALEYAALKAAEAEQDIIKMEEEKAERERLERERKAKLKQKHKDKLRSEKERLHAEKEAKEREELEKQQLQEQERRDREEAEKKRRAEEIEAARRQEEEIMEARRRELLKQDGYWKERMQKDAEARARLEEELLLKVEDVGNGVAETQDDFVEEAHVSKRAKPRRRRTGDAGSDGVSVSNPAPNGYTHRDRSRGEMRWEQTSTSSVRQNSPDPSERRSSSAATDRSSESRPRSAAGQVNLFPSERNLSLDSQSSSTNAENLPPVPTSADKPAAVVDKTAAGPKKEGSIGTAAPAPPMQPMPNGAMSPLLPTVAAASYTATGVAPRAMPMSERMSNSIDEASQATGKPAGVSRSTSIPAEPSALVPIGHVPREQGTTPARPPEIAASRPPVTHPAEPPRSLPVPGSPSVPVVSFPANTANQVNKTAPAKMLAAPQGPAHSSAQTKPQVLTVPRPVPLPMQQTPQGPRPQLPGQSVGAPVVPLPPPSNGPMRPVMPQATLHQPVASTSRPAFTPAHMLHVPKGAMPKVNMQPAAAGPVPSAGPGHVERNRPGDMKPGSVPSAVHPMNSPIVPPAVAMERSMSHGSDTMPSGLPAAGPMTSNLQGAPVHMMHPPQNPMQPVMMPAAGPYGPHGPHFPSMNMPGHPQGVPAMAANGHPNVPMMMPYQAGSMLGQHMQAGGAIFNFNPYHMMPVPMMVPGANSGQHGHHNVNTNSAPNKSATAPATTNRATNSVLRAGARPFVPQGMRSSYNYLGMKQQPRPQSAGGHKVPPPARNQPAAPSGTSSASTAAPVSGPSAQTGPPSSSTSHVRSAAPPPPPPPVSQQPPPFKGPAAPAQDVESPKGVLDRADTSDNSTEDSSGPPVATFVATSAREATSRDRQQEPGSTVPDATSALEEQQVRQVGMPAAQPASTSGLPSGAKVLVLPRESALTNVGGPPGQGRPQQPSQQQNQLPQQGYQKRPQQPFQQPRWSAVAAQQVPSQPSASTRPAPQPRQAFSRDLANRNRYNEAASQPKQLLRPPSASQAQQAVPPAAVQATAQSPALPEAAPASAGTSQRAAEAVTGSTHSTAASQPVVQSGVATSVSSRASSEDASTATRVTDAAVSPDGGKPGGLMHVNSVASSLSTASTESKKRKIRKAGGLTVEGLEDDLKRLKLVRGLINDSGQYNCFLNVIIQSLWHLRCFREYMLNIKLADVEARNSCPDAVQVMKALRNIFHAFAEAPEDIDIEEEGEVSSQSNAKGASTFQTDGNEAMAVNRSSGSWAVSPTQLREALSVLGKQGGASGFEEQEMHDASEVLDAIFACLHRAEFGRQFPDTPWDEDKFSPQLPLVWKVPAKTVGNTPVPTSSDAARASPSNGTVANGVSKVDSSKELQFHSIVQGLFGLEMQRCSPSEEEQDEEQGFNKKQTKWQKKQAANGVQRKPKSTGLVEVSQFTKYWHLVPARGLRAAAEWFPNAPFEDLLREADSAADLMDKGLRLSRAETVPKEWLLGRSRVFTLNIGWESPQISQDYINATMNAVKTSFDASGVFKSMGTGFKCQLRCIVTYFGHHYQSYALSEELHQWLLFDDTTIKLMGDWKDVVANICSNRIQPSVLFYEAVPS